MGRKFEFNEGMDLIHPALRSGPPTSLYDCEAIYPWFEAMLRYEPDTGTLIWNQMTPDDHNRWAIVATRRNKYGRGMVRFDGFSVSSNHLVWFLHHRRWPEGRLIHLDDDVTNDRIENLGPKRQRIPDEAPVDVNPPERRGRPRFRPVGVARLHDRWQAYAPLPLGRRKNLGVFKTQEAAVAARKAWDDGDDLF